MLFPKLILQHIVWRGLYLLSALILNIVIARYFKADGSGWIFYVINNLSFALLVAGLSLEAGATYYVASGEINPEKIAGCCLLWSLAATIFCLLFVTTILPADHLAFSSSKEYFFACAGYIWGVLLTTYFRALFFAKHDFFTPNLVLLILNLLWIVLLAISGKQSFIILHFATVYFLLFLSQGLVIAVCYYNKNSGKLFGLLTFPELKKVIRYSLLALAANIIFFLVYRIDYWFVKKFCSYSDLGNYIQVSKIGQLLILLPSTIASTVFPLAAAGKSEEMNKTVQTITRFLLLIIGCICLLLAIVGKWAFPYFFGKSFFQMYILFLFLIPGILALAAHYPLTAFYAGKKKISVNIKGSLLALIIIIAADLVFLPLSGIKAAPIVSSIGYLSYYLYVLFIFKKEYRGSLIDFFIFKKNDIQWLKKMLRLEGNSQS